MKTHVDNVAPAGTKTAAIRHALRWIRAGKIVAVTQNAHGAWMAVEYVCEGEQCTST